MIKSYLKYLAKVRFFYPLRNIGILFFGVPANKDGWEDRILFINLEGLGDVVIMTGILKNYKNAFPGKRIYLLITRSSGLTVDLLPEGIAEVIHIDYPSFAKNIWYGISTINKLRSIGFQTVINHDPSLAEINGKIIAVSLGAEKIIGYEGLGIQFQKPFDSNMKNNMAFVRRKLYPYYTEIIPSLDRYSDLRNRIPHFIRHYAAIFKGIAGNVAADLSSELRHSPTSDRKILNLLEQGGIRPGEYIVLSLGTTTINREWPPARFAEAARVLQKKNIPIVLTGSRRETSLAAEFKSLYKGQVLDLIGRTSVSDLISLIYFSLASWSNDTGAVHIGIALKKPTLAILGIGHFGMLSHYGYRAINRWVFKKRFCLCDNWRCIHEVGPHPVPCIQLIQVDDVARELQSLLEEISRPNQYQFEIEFKDPL